MKFLRRLFVTIVVIIALGVGVYYFGTNLIADKMMTQVSDELETSGQLEQIKHTKISSADQGIGSHYYFLYSRGEE